MTRKRRKKSWPPIAAAVFCIGILWFTINFLHGKMEQSGMLTANPGVWVAVNYPVHGIDVSHHQSKIDWQKVSASKVNESKIKFAFIRATNGVEKEDIYFTQNWRQCKEVGIARGAYHYFRANENANQQADFFIHNVQLLPGDLPPVVDVEKTYGVSQEALINGVKQWLNRVEAHYGVKPIIYSSTGFYAHHFEGYFDKYPFWVAHYNLGTNMPRTQRGWHFWQHSETGSIPGIKGAVDFNVFNGDSQELKMLLVR